MIDWRRIRVEEFPTTSSHRWGGGTAKARDDCQLLHGQPASWGGSWPDLAVAPRWGLSTTIFANPLTPPLGGCTGTEQYRLLLRHRSRRRHLSALHHPALLSDSRFTIFAISATRIITVLRFTALEFSNAGTHRHAACAQLLKGRKTSEPSSSASAAKFRLRLPLPATRPWSGNPLTFGLPALQEVGSLRA